MGEEEREWHTKPRSGDVEFGEGFGWIAEVVGYRALEEAAKKVAEEVHEILKEVTGSDGDEIGEGGVTVVLVDSLEFLEAPFLVQQVRVQLRTIVQEVCEQIKRNEQLRGGTTAPGEEFVEAISIAGILAGLGAASDLLSAIQDVAGFFRSDYQVTSRRLPISQAHAYAEVHRALSSPDVRLRRHFPAGLEALADWTKGNPGSGKPCDPAQTGRRLFQHYKVALEASLLLRDTVGRLQALLPDGNLETDQTDPTAKIKGAIEASEELVKTSGEALKNLLEPRQGESLGLLGRAALWDIDYENNVVYFLHLIVLPTSADVALKGGLWNRKEVDASGGAGLAFSLFDSRGRSLTGGTVLTGGRARYEFWVDAEEWHLPEVKTRPFPDNRRK